MKTLLAGMTHNVDTTKSTRFLTNGDYDSNIAVLKAKQQLLNSDPTTPQSDLDSIDRAVKQGQVLKDGKYKPSVVDDYKNTSVSDWRKMGDPTDDLYDQKTYDLLWQYDNALAKAGASGDPHDPTGTKFTVKPPSKRGSGSGSSSAKSNTLNSTPTFQTVSLANLAPQKITTAAVIPTIQQVKPGDLIKKRAISVSKA